jgi:hypothetical protein
MTPYFMVKIQLHTNPFFIYSHQKDMKVFVHRVDQLIYQGKKNGKDRVCCES